MKNTAEQKNKKRKLEWLAPWQFKPGQSGNPSGRTFKGESLKEYAKRMFGNMTSEEKEEFFRGLNKFGIWEMAEGKAKQDVGVGMDNELKEFLLKLNKTLDE